MWFDIILLVLSVSCLLVGFLGALLPLPGPPMSFLGILLLEWSRFADFSSGVLWGLGLATLAVALVDYYFPIYGLKKFGGSTSGMWGSTIGMIIGLFIGPWGIFIGAFIGGLVGELIEGKDSAAAAKAAFGSFIGFLFGVVLKVGLCGTMIWYAAVAIWGFFSAA